MKLYRFSMIAIIACTSLLFVQCADDDDNGNVIETATCSDGLMNGDEEGVDCGGSACEPCVVGMELDFSGTFIQEDVMGRPGINTVFGGDIKNDFNNSVVSDRASFQAPFQDRLEFYHDLYAMSLGIPVEDLDYETNILGLDAATFTTVLAQFDALQVAPDAQTTYFDPVTGVALTGRTLGDDVIDISLILSFGGTTGTRFDGNNGTPQLTSDGVDAGDRDFSLSFPYMETPNQ